MSQIESESSYIDPTLRPTRPSSSHSCLRVIAQFYLFGCMFAVIVIDIVVNRRPLIELSLDSVGKRVSIRRQMHFGGRTKWSVCN